MDDTMIVRQEIGRWLKRLRVIEAAANHTAEGDWILDSQTTKSFVEGRKVAELLVRLFPEGPDIVSEMVSISAHDPEKPTTAGARSYNWDVLVRELGAIGVPITRELKDLIVARDTDLIAQILEHLHQLIYEQNSIPASKPKNSKAAKVEFGLADIQSSYAEPISDTLVVQRIMDPMKCRSSQELIAMCISFVIQIPMKQARKFYSSKSEKLHTLLTTGFKGDYSLSIQLIKAIADQVHTLARLLCEKDLHRYIFHHLHQIGNSSLRSLHRGVSIIGIGLLTTLRSDMRRIHAEGYTNGLNVHTDFYKWFIEYGGLRSVVLCQKNHSDINSILAPLVVEVAQDNYVDVFCKHLPGHMHELRFMGFITQALATLAERMTREKANIQPLVNYFTEFALRQQKREEHSEAANALLSEIFKHFPDQVDSLSRSAKKMLEVVEKVTAVPEGSFSWLADPRDPFFKDQVVGISFSQKDPTKKAISTSQDQFLGELLAMRPKPSIESPRPSIKQTRSNPSRLSMNSRMDFTPDPWSKQRDPDQKVFSTKGEIAFACAVGESEVWIVDSSGSVVVRDSKNGANLACLSVPSALAVSIPSTASSSNRPALDNVLFAKITCVEAVDKLVCLGSEDGCIYVYNAVNKQPITTVQGHTAGITYLLCSGKYLFSCGRDLKILQWDILSWTPLGEYIGHSDIVRCLLGIGQSFLWSASDDTSIRVWDLTVGSERKPLILGGHQAPVTRLVATTSYRSTGEIGVTCRVWSASADCCIRVWKTHGDIECLTVINLAPSPIYALTTVGLQHVWVSTDTGIHVYDAGTMKQAKKLSSLSNQGPMVVPVTAMFQSQELYVTHIWCSSSYDGNTFVWRHESWADVHDTETMETSPGRGRALDILARNSVLEDRMQVLSAEKQSFAQKIAEMEANIQLRVQEELTLRQSTLVDEKKDLVHKLTNVQDLCNSYETKCSELASDVERLKREKNRLQEKIETQGKEIADVLESNAKIVRLNRDQFERMELERQAEYQRKMNEYESMIAKNSTLYDEELRKMKSEHRKEIENMVKRNDEEKAQIVEANRREIERLEIANSQVTTADRERYRREVDSLQREIERLQAEHNALLNTLDHETHENLSKLKVGYEKEITQLRQELSLSRTELQNEVEALREARRQEVLLLHQKLQEDLRREKERSESERLSAIESQKILKDKEINDLKSVIERMKESQRQDLKDREEDWKSQKRVQEQAVQEIHDLHAKALRDKEREIDKLKSDLQSLAERGNQQRKEMEEKLERLRKDYDAESARVRREYERQAQMERESYLEDQKKWNISLSEKELQIRELRADLQQITDDKNLQIADLVRQSEQMKSHMKESLEDAKRREEELKADYSVEIAEKESAVRKLKEEIQILIQRYHEVSGMSSEAVSSLNAEIARLTSMIETKDLDMAKYKKDCNQKIEDMRQKHEEDMKRKLGEKNLQMDQLQSRITTLEKERIESRNKNEKEKGELQVQIDKLKNQVQAMSISLSDSDYPKIEFFLQESAQLLELLKQAALKTRDIKAAVRTDNGIPIGAIRTYVAENLGLLHDCANNLEKTLATISSGSQRHHLGIRASGGIDAESQERLNRLRESYRLFWQELDAEA